MEQERTSSRDPTSAKVTLGVGLNPSRRTLGCTLATAASKSDMDTARPLHSHLTPLIIHADLEAPRLRNLARRQDASFTPRSPTWTLPNPCIRSP